jgi:LacI family transcriptional regulator
MPTRPTLHTVAGVAGVSIATVSKVVNGIAVGVSDATRAKVLEAIAALGYRPNRLGRNLRRLSHATIAMAVVDPSPTFLADPFITNLVAGLANVLSRRDFGLLVQGVQPGALRQSRLARELEVDGMCVLLSGDEAVRFDHLGVLAGLGAPVIAFQEPQLPAIADVCSVRQDDRGGAAEIARRLLDRGARDVVMFVPEVWWPATTERIAGLAAALEAAGATLAVVGCDETRVETIARAVEERLERAGLPEAVVGQNDQIALAAMQVLKARGASVPGDVAVYGFNAFPFSQFADPQLTTVRSPAYQLGETGGELLLERIATGRFRTRERVLPVSFLPGQSG